MQQLRYKSPSILKGVQIKHHTQLPTYERTIRFDAIKFKLQNSHAPQLKFQNSHAKLKLQNSLDASLDKFLKRI